MLSYLFINKPEHANLSDLSLFYDLPSCRLIVDLGSCFYATVSVFTALTALLYVDTIDHVVTVLLCVV